MTSISFNNVTPRRGGRQHSPASRVTRSRARDRVSAESATAVSQSRGHASSAVVSRRARGRGNSITEVPETQPMSTGSVTQSETQYSNDDHMFDDDDDGAQRRSSPLPYIEQSQVEEDLLPSPSPPPAEQATSSFVAIEEPGNKHELASQDSQQNGGNDTAEAPLPASTGNPGDLDMSPPDGNLATADVVAEVPCPTSNGHIGGLNTPPPTDNNDGRNASREASPGVEMVAGSNRAVNRPDLISIGSRMNRRIRVLAGSKANNLGEVHEMNDVSGNRDVAARSIGGKADDLTKAGNVPGEKRKINTVNISGKENILFNIHVENSAVSHPLVNLHLYGADSEEEGQGRKKQKLNE